MESVKVFITAIVSLAFIALITFLIYFMVKKYCDAFPKRNKEGTISYDKQKSEELLAVEV